MDENPLFKTLHRPVELEVVIGNIVNVFETRIVQSAPETIGVDAPRDENGTMVVLEKGTPVKLLVTEASVVFMFDSVVIEGVAPEKVPTLVLQKPTNMTNPQRRKSFRVLTEKFPVDITVLKGANPATLHGICKEISGSGMMLMSDHKLPVECNLELVFKLEGEPEEVSLPGHVKRVEHMKRSSLFEYRLGIFFTDISERMREKLIKYTFRQQRRLIQRGLL